MAAKVLMVQGTSSGAGKSLFVAGLCRLLARRGLRVAPFKGQNISNNAAVCADGAEIGRSQAVQAIAAGLLPSADMNPVLLKPEGQGRTQIITMGRLWRTLSAWEYYKYKADVWPLIPAALDRLRAQYDLVIIEGAGSPAELNLRAGDMANMAIALHAQAPVLLLGDIDRGGIFAQLLGTLWLLAPAERALVQGLIVNKFRGNAAFFADGVRILEERGGVPVLGVVPFIPDLHVPEEDAVALDEPPLPMTQAAEVDIAVLRLPHIANFDDFAPLAAEERVQVRYVGTPERLGTPHAVILPGTKSTMADLAWLRAQGLEPALHALAQRGTPIVGICGGYQMLGRRIYDPDGVESPIAETPGLGLLPVETTFIGEKATHQAEAQILDAPGWLGRLAGQTIQGYEIHMGRTSAATPWLQITRQSGHTTALADGASAAHGQIWGCYLHGLFANDGLRHAWLASLGWQGGGPNALPISPLVAMLDRVADCLETHLDHARLDALTRIQ